MNTNVTNEELCALSDKELLTRLSLETRAASRIYEVEGQTRCDAVVLDGGCELLLKREDLSRVHSYNCLLYTSPSPRDATLSRMPSSA